MYRLRNILDTCSIRVEASGQLVVLLGGGLLVLRGHISYPATLISRPDMKGSSLVGGRQERGAPVMKRRLLACLPPLPLITLDRSILGWGGSGAEIRNGAYSRLLFSPTQCNAIIFPFGSYNIFAQKLFLIFYKFTFCSFHLSTSSS